MTTRLGQETAIVWLENIDRLDYVRQSVEYCHFRRRRPSWRGQAGRLVGYSVLAPDAQNIGHRGAFERRVFWLKDYDRDSGQDTYTTGAPAEAVDPRTVSPGVWGTVTERAWGRAFTEEVRA